MTTRLPQTDWKGFYITNHSGLDAKARATPAQLASLPQYGLNLYHLPHLLPADAWSGSLSRRLVEQEHLQRIWAKTGSIDFAAALAENRLNASELEALPTIAPTALKRRAGEK